MSEKMIDTSILKAIHEHTALAERRALSKVALPPIAPIARETPSRDMVTATIAAAVIASSGKPHSAQEAVMVLREVQQTMARH